MVNKLKKAVIITSVLALAASSVSSVYAEPNTKEEEYKKPGSDSSQNLDSICAEMNKEIASYRNIQDILSKGGEGYIKLERKEGENYICDKSTGELYLEQIVESEELDKYHSPIPILTDTSILHLKSRYGSDPVNALLCAIEIAGRKDKEEVKTIFEYGDGKPIVMSEKIDFSMKYVQDQLNLNKVEGKPYEIGVPILVEVDRASIFFNSKLTENNEW